MNHKEVLIAKFATAVLLMRSQQEALRTTEDALTRDMYHSFVIEARLVKELFVTFYNAYLDYEYLAESIKITVDGEIAKVIPYPMHKWTKEGWK